MMIITDTIVSGSIEDNLRTNRPHQIFDQQLSCLNQIIHLDPTYFYFLDEVQFFL